MARQVWGQAANSNQKAITGLAKKIARHSRIHNAAQERTDSSALSSNAASESRAEALDNISYSCLSHYTFRSSLIQSYTTPLYGSWHRRVVARLLGRGWMESDCSVDVHLRPDITRWSSFKDTGFLVWDFFFFNLGLALLNLMFLDKRFTKGWILLFKQRVIVCGFTRAGKAGLYPGKSFRMFSNHRHT